MRASRWATSAGLRECQRCGPQSWTMSFQWKDRAQPPTTSSFSRTTTLAPPDASLQAHESPANPPPST